jgi:hypothetical protein
MPKANEMRLAHARVVGKLAAQKLLVELSQATVSAQNWIYVTFKFFSPSEKTQIRDEIVVKLDGVDKDSGIMEMSASDVQAFTLKLMTTAATNAIQRQLRGMLEDEGFHVIDNRAAAADGGGDVIIIEKRR